MQARQGWSNTHRRLASAQRTWLGEGCQQSSLRLSRHTLHPGKSGRLSDAAGLGVKRLAANKHTQKQRNNNKNHSLPGLSPDVPGAAVATTSGLGVGGPGFPRKGDLCEGSKTRDSGRGAPDTV